MQFQAILCDNAIFVVACIVYIAAVVAVVVCAVVMIVDLMVDADVYHCKVLAVVVAVEGNDVIAVVVA